MEVLTRAFYAQHDTRTPVIIGTIAMTLNVIFSFVFIRLFSQNGWMPHGGLALANSLATALEATALFIFMRRRLKGMEGVTSARICRLRWRPRMGVALALDLKAKPAKLVVALGVATVASFMELASCCCESGNSDHPRSIKRRLLPVGSQ
jgi:putative peptidoglycan lipid II flippase